VLKHDETLRNKIISGLKREIILLTKSCGKDDVKNLRSSL
jgi:hypothetical protein